MIVFSILLLHVHGVALFIGSSPTRVAVHSDQIRKKKKKGRRIRKRIEEDYFQLTKTRKIKRKKERIQ